MDREDVKRLPNGQAVGAGAQSYVTSHKSRGALIHPAAGSVSPRVLGAGKAGLLSSLGDKGMHPPAPSPSLSLKGAKHGSPSSSSSRPHSRTPEWLHGGGELPSPAQLRAATSPSSVSRVGGRSRSGSVTSENGHVRFAEPDRSDLSDSPGARRDPCVTSFGPRERVSDALRVTETHYDASGVRDQALSRDARVKDAADRGRFSLSLRPADTQPLSLGKGGGSPGVRGKQPGGRVSDMDYTEEEGDYYTDPARAVRTDREPVADCAGSVSAVSSPTSSRLHNTRLHEASPSYRFIDSQTAAANPRHLQPSSECYPEVSDTQRVLSKSNLKTSSGRSSSTDWHRVSHDPSLRLNPAFRSSTSAAAISSPLLRGGRSQVQTVLHSVLCSSGPTSPEDFASSSSTSSVSSVRETLSDSPSVGGGGGNIRKSGSREGGSTHRVTFDMSTCSRDDGYSTCSRRPPLPFSSPRESPRGDYDDSGFSSGPESRGPSSQCRSRGRADSASSSSSSSRARSESLPPRSRRDLALDLDLRTGSLERILLDLQRREGGEERGGGGGGGRPAICITTSSSSSSPASSGDSGFFRHKPSPSSTSGFPPPPLPPRLPSALSSPSSPLLNTPTPSPSSSSDSGPTPSPAPSPGFYRRMNGFSRSLGEISALLAKKSIADSYDLETCWFCGRPMAGIPLPIVAGGGATGGGVGGGSGEVGPGGDGGGEGESRFARGFLSGVG
ncbi:hypothetical protein ACOMHN_000645 [Nucella lapillus]